MSYELFIAKRYFKAKRRTGFISVMSVLSFAGVTVGVAALLTVLSVMNGAQTELRNKILPLGHKAIVAKVYKDKSWLDQKECIVLDYSKTSLVAHWVRDEIREVAPGLYLGVVYWGKKKLIHFALKFPPANGPTVTPHSARVR